MNFLAHHHCAMATLGIEATHPIAVGCVLPDLASIAGQRLRIEDWRPRVREGIAFHVACDTMFHRLPWFLAMQRHGTAELSGAGVSRGAARAVSHVGVELLLDGALLERRNGQTHARTLLAELALLKRHSLPTSAAGLAASTLASAADSIDPDVYRSPTTVAHRLRHILARRVRLRLQSHDIAPVTDWLESVNREVNRRAGSIAEEVAAAAATGLCTGVPSNSTTPSPDQSD